VATYIDGMVRFYALGPRSILGIRPGISFSARDLARLFGRRKSLSPIQNFVPTGTADVPDIGKPFVYVIHGQHGRTKVGCSGNPNQRLMQLRTASAFPLKLEFVGLPESDDGEKIERCVHDMLDRFRVDGEWFTCPPELCISAIYGAASRYGEKLVHLTPEQVDQTLQVLASRRAAAQTPPPLPKQSSGRLGWTILGGLAVIGSIAVTRLIEHQGLSGALATIGGVVLKVFGVTA
jgi:hypothetical protein